MYMTVHRQTRNISNHQLDQEKGKLKQVKVWIYTNTVNLLHDMPRLVINVKGFFVLNRIVMVVGQVALQNYTLDFQLLSDFLSVKK